MFSKFLWLNTFGITVTYAIYIVNYIRIYLKLSEILLTIPVGKKIIKMCFFLFFLLSPSFHQILLSVPYKNK